MFATYLKTPLKNLELYLKHRVCSGTRVAELLLQEANVL
jgi:hypothetical protein